MKTAIMDPITYAIPSVHRHHKMSLQTIHTFYLLYLWLAISIVSFNQLKWSIRDKANSRLPLALKRMRCGKESCAPSDNISNNYSTLYL